LVPVVVSFPTPPLLESHSPPTLLSAKTSPFFLIYPLMECRSPIWTRRVELADPRGVQLPVGAPPLPLSPLLFYGTGLSFSFSAEFSFALKSFLPFSPCVGARYQQPGSPRASFPPVGLFFSRFCCSRGSFSSLYFFPPHHSVKNAASKPPLSLRPPKSTRSLPFSPLLLFCLSEMTFLFSAGGFL